MQETGLVSQKELGFFQRIRKQMLIKNITKEKFLKAPDYLKRDSEVIDAITSKDCSVLEEIDINELPRVLGGRENLTRLLSKGRVTELLTTFPETIHLFSDNDRKKIIYSNENLWGCIKYLDEAEQINLLTKEQEYEGEREFNSKGLSRTHFGRPSKFGKNLDCFSIDAIKQAFVVLKQHHNYDKYNKDKISLLSKLDLSGYDIEFQKEIAKIDPDFMIPIMSDEAAIEFVNGNPLLISKLNKRCVETMIKQNPALINCVSLYEYEYLIKDNPDLISSLFSGRRLDMRLTFPEQSNIVSISELKNEMVQTYSTTYSFSKIPSLIKDPKMLIELGQFSPQALSPTYGDANIIEHQNYIISLYNGIVDDDIINAWQTWQNTDSYARDPKEFLNIVKVISNSDVLERVPSDKIIDYIKSQDMEKMREIITLAYGENAKKVLDARPGLRFEDIPNLYIFDEKVFELFGEGTVHQMLSYDTKGVMVLADLVRNEDRLELFKKFEEMNIGIFEDSALGLEQKLKIFSEHSDLIEQLTKEPLTDERRKSLSLVISTELGDTGFEGKIIGVKDMEQLDSYAQRLTEVYDDFFSKADNPEEIKDVISRKFFGVSYVDDRESYSPNNYPLEAILSYYNVGTFITDERTMAGGKFSQDELDKLEIAKIISEIDDVDTLRELYTRLSSERDVTEVLDFKDTVKKIPLQYSEELVSSLLTTEKAMELIDKGESGISIHNQNGIDIINLHGVDFKILIHSMGLNNSGISGIYGKDEAELWKQLEGGISTISGSVIEAEMLKSCDNPYGINLGFASVPPEQIIGMGHTDIHVSHQLKDINPYFSYGQVKYNYSDELIRKTAAQISGVETKDPTHEYNEVTMHRTMKSSKDITSENGGGKIMPDYIVVYGEASERHLNAAKRFGNIPVIEINTDVYVDRLSQRANKKEDHTVERETSDFMHEIKKVVGEDDGAR